MSYMIEISDSKVEKMSGYVEDMLWAGGELMHCLQRLKEEDDGYGERNDYRGGSYGNRGRYGNRYDGMNYRGGSMGYRDDDDDEWERDEMMGERRGRRRRDSMGRYR